LKNVQPLHLKKVAEGKGEPGGEWNYHKEHGVRIGKEEINCRHLEIGKIF
jgi:hypothetical protein